MDLVACDQSIIIFLKKVIVFYGPRPVKIMLINNFWLLLKESSEKRLGLYFKA